MYQSIEMKSKVQIATWGIFIIYTKWIK